jgi:NADH-quinone oxidoreductase subunit E
VQPESFTFSPENLAWAQATIAKYPNGKQASAVVPVLWRAQEQNGGWVSRPAMEYVARLLGMAYIRVYEVATFYTMFQLSPVGRKAHVQVCGTTPCMLRGSEDLKAVCRRRIHEEQFHLSANGDFSWEEVECLGACVNAPMVQIGRDTYEDLTVASLEAILDGFASGQPVKPGPQTSRQFSAPITGLTSLTDKRLYVSTRSIKDPEAVPDAPHPNKSGSVTPGVPAAPLARVSNAPKNEVAQAKERESRVDRPSAKTQPKEERLDKSQPLLLTQPRDGIADDLKLIWGIGPKLEKMLNSMGIWHFDQIARWTSNDLKWVDERLEGFKGRAKRDEWIKQSRKLAKGWRPNSAIGERPK